MSIYKPCDIRGHAGTELTPELYRSWGRTLGLQLEPMSKFVVGGDVRQSTGGFLAALVEGLSQTGVDVVNLGILPTPMIYYAKRQLSADGSAIVTASHNPPEFNGLKWMLGNRPPTQEEVLLLAEKGTRFNLPERPGGCFAQIKPGPFFGSLKGKAEPTATEPSGRRPGTPRSLDIGPDYVAWLQQYWADSRQTRFSLVLDPMCGCWAGRAKRYLHAVFPEVPCSVVHDEPDPVFGGQNPDCSRAELLEQLSRMICRQKADLGIAFDGDGDRVALVDGQGLPLTAEETTCILLESFGFELEGKPFVFDQKFSDRVPEAARKLGARPLVERSGHAFIRTRMLDSGALFGAEISGHYFFGELAGGDDGLFAACRMIAYLNKCETTLAQLRRRCPPVFMTPDLRVPVDVKAQQEVIERVRAAWSDHPQQAIDGVRVDFPDGWALVRSSVTEPALTFRFESDAWPALGKLVRRFCKELDELGDDLLEQFAAAMQRQEH